MTSAVTYYVLALATSLILVAALLFVRSRVKSNRQRTIHELRLLFFPHQQVSIAAFDYVRAKYEMETSAESRGAAPEARPPSLGALLISSIPYLILCALGFIILIVPHQQLLSGTFGPPMLVDNLFWSMAGEPTPATLREGAAVFAAAFLGGYLMTGRILLRAVQNYELNHLTFLQAATHLTFGIVSGMMVYHILRGVGLATNLIGDQGFSGFLLVAFIGGYIPTYGLNVLTQYLRVRVFKAVDEKAFERAKSFPLELLDGIDYDTRYRLEQSGMADVQSLATANPLLIYVETPYGLYCAFDWVLQAQLCVAVGPHVFQDLRSYNVRTSLDLERAILADDAPDDFVVAVGALLYPRGQGGGTDNQPLSVAAIKHGVMVMLDDLHVHRVRLLWRHISLQIAGDEMSPWIYRTFAGLGPGNAAAASATAAGLPAESLIVAVPTDPAEGQDITSTAEAGAEEAAAAAVDQRPA